MLDWLIGLVGRAAPALLYLLLGAGAALENLVPPVPADTFVLFGGFLAALGHADAMTVFWVTWGANVVSALAVYWAGYRYGKPFFGTRLGRRLLHADQLETVGRFYRRWGLPVIFATRFLPGLRAVVPVFAGVTRQPAWAVALPITVASAIWYGILVWVGATAGRNWPEIVGWLEGVNRVLLVVVVAAVAAMAIWWYRSRKRRG